jgi:hypothetical protein
MGNPTLYYYPDTALSAGSVGRLEKVDLGPTISDIQISPIRSVSDSVSLSGRASRTSWQSGIAVRLTLERFTDDALARDLYSFSSHAERGFHFGFALDKAKAFACVPGLFEWERGRTLIIGQTNIFDRWEPAATLAVDDIVHISGAAPKNNREEHKLAAFSKLATTTSITLADPLRYDHPYPAVFRHRDFYPVLYVPEADVNRPMLTHDHRISWTWECSAVLYPSWAASMSAQADGMADAQPGHGDDTSIDGILRSGTTAAVPSADSKIIEVRPEITIHEADLYVPEWSDG